MHKNLKHFHVRSLSREQVGLCLFDVMSVVRVRDDGVSVFLFMGGFPFIVPVSVGMVCDCKEACRYVR